jgi:multidrug efflux pump subunit AcrA (membrane-fusion protein)
MAMNMTVRTTSNLQYGRLGLAAALLLATAGCSRSNVQAAAPAMPAPLVTVVKATAQDVPKYLDEIGRNAAFESVTVTPQVGGRIVERHFQDGENLKKGQLLFVVDPRPGPAGIWNLAASVTQPIFQGGRLKSNVRLTEAQREQMRLTYEQTIQGAFRDVSNGLIAYRKNREFRIQQEHLLESARDAARLSEVRFKAGTTDYLEVLTNETNSFSAELGLAQAQANELISLVQIYQALGGGWQE